MDVTISSIFTTAFLCSIVILILCQLFKNQKVASIVGPRCMIIILSVVLIRMFIPFEFFYTYTVPVYKVLSPIRKVLTHEVYSGNFSITVWYLVVLVLGLVALELFARQLFLYKRMRRYVRMAGGSSLEKFCEKHALDINRLEPVSNVSIVISDMVKTPYLLGIRKPCVVLPSTEYSVNQLYYILNHEFMHICKYDIVWKIIIDLLCTAFWWNPVFWYLKKELFQMIEMRNDAYLTKKMAEEEQVEYMECLCDMVDKTVGQNVAFSVSFSKNNVKEMKRRFLMIASDDSTRKSAQIVTFVLTAMVLLATSVVVFEPWQPIEDESVGTPLTTNNTFLITNGNTYDVYVDGEYMFNTDDLSPFQGVDIFESLEEAQKAL